MHFLKIGLLLFGRLIFGAPQAPPVSVTVAPPSPTYTLGGAPITFTATVANDPSGAGVTWQLTDDSGAPCAPVCGTLANVTATSADFVPPPDPASAPTISGVIVAKAR